MAKKKKDTHGPSYKFLVRIAEDSPLVEGLKRYLADVRPKSTRQAVVEAALEEYLRSKGYLSSSITIIHKAEDDDGSGT
jgi:hypothetical protein